jgi:hypothetical protein
MKISQQQGEIMIVKSKEEIERLKKLMQEDLDRLPDFTIFRDSYDEDRREISRGIEELEHAYKMEEIMDEESDVGYWLRGENDIFGRDYGLEE